MEGSTVFSLDELKVDPDDLISWTISRIYQHILENNYDYVAWSRVKKYDGCHGNNHWNRFWDSALEPVGDNLYKIKPFTQ